MPLAVKGSRTLGVLNSRAEGSDRDGFVEIVDSEFLLVKPVDEIFQRFTLLLLHRKELCVGLGMVEQPNELANKLFAELPEVPDGPWL